MKISRRTHPHAFTLLEIMVAIALLAMIVIAIYASWNSILKGSRVALDAAASAQRTRITMRALHDSLLCAVMFSASPTNYAFEAEGDSDFSMLSFVARLPKSFPRGGKFGDLTMRRLEFTVESGHDSSRQLVLRQRPLIMDFDKDEMQFPLVLAKDVTKFLIEYVDPQTGDWVTEWTATNQLPKEIRITVGLGHLDQFSKESQEAMVSIVAPPSVAVRPEWQLAANRQTGNLNGGQNGNQNNNPNGNNPNGNLNGGLPGGKGGVPGNTSFPH
jgi:type II secretion system protein J